MFSVLVISNLAFNHNAYAPIVFLHAAALIRASAACAKKYTHTRKEKDSLAREKSREMKLAKKTQNWHINSSVVRQKANYSPRNSSQLRMEKPDISEQISINYTTRVHIHIA